MRALLRKFLVSFLVLPVFGVLLSSQQANAGGTFQLKGTVKSFTPDELLINDGTQIYSLKRKTLPATEQSKLKNLKAKMEVELTVPFSSVTTVE
ncbi:MAG: hypothetical protein EOP05_14550 [Proteobacteria bacterium]|nr:MAG: hypothetical protein EOP05_14550 [Pseudomonadota bacterium]